MALAHAILVSLIDRPQSGYDLAKRFDQTVGYFWKASHQQIYQELHKLDQAGWVSAERVEQSQRPHRILYALTAPGREALDAWIAQPTEPPAYKEELLVKLFALGESNSAVLLDELRRRQDFHRQRLAHYEAVMAEHYAEPSALKARKRGRYLGLRMGVLWERTTIAWCDEALALIGTLKDTPPRRAAASAPARGRKRRA